MKDNRQKETARRFGILARCEALESDLLKIPGVVDIDFDLDGFFDNMHQVIVLVKYDIDISRPDYFDARLELLKSCTMAMLLRGLTPSGDQIEDYGEHFYFVRQCSKAWEGARQ